ncbi:hypothetical protein [Amycolatopsis sp. H20-H5]|uniref:hypothetical protein n=1 Tax=Amycolatopsis sp. H20-H5 TaxID=3046309 RepID=UPI002DBA902E|nr:hypothetical protein [Amycolatopsis sp. H20-H5]MEC3980183.1 hypothetical protein [Amycolatopsis sp. H20-H5]
MAKRIVVGTAAAALSVLAVGGLAGTAQASTAAASSFRLCNVGTDYTTYVSFPDRGDYSSYVLSYGQCWNGDSNPGEQFYLTVQRKDNPAYFATTLDRTNNATWTVVTTKNTFNSFAYDKQ